MRTLVHLSVIGTLLLAAGTSFGQAVKAPAGQVKEKSPSKEAKPGVLKTDVGVMEILEVTFEITQADQEAVARDPAKFVRAFLESHGQVVNDVVLTTTFAKEMSDAIEKGPKGGPVYKSGRVGHVGSPKDLKSLHVAFLAKTEDQDNSKARLKKVADEPMTIYQVDFEIPQADQETAVKDPAKFVRGFLESHGQKVNNVVLSTSFAKEMSDAIATAPKGGSAQLRSRLCHLDGHYWSWFVRVK